ncbi:MAG: DUF1501 domain-containing protein [Thermoanaerobaculia bacterium]
MVSRRVFLKSGALTLFSLGAGPHFLDRLALAAPASGSRPKVLVSIFLRGAMDGLMAVPPIADPDLRQFRPQLAMSAARASADPIHDLDGRFGLHPAFAPLLPLWADGRLAVVHAVGSPNPTRSHFDAQDYMEMGTPWRRSTPSGWLNRLAAVAGPPPSPFRAVSLSPTVPRSLVGDEPALAITDLGKLQLTLPWEDETVEAIGFDLEKLYREHATGLLDRRSREMFAALRAISQKELVRYRQQRAQLYPPRNHLAQSLMQIAYLIKADLGLRIACAETDGWDTHVGQGTIRGRFAARAGDLAAAIAAFWADIEPYHDDVVVLTMTEFGRTVRENGSQGTDHGHGSCLFVLGNQVDGGKVYGEFPERLDPELLFEGRDLPVTTDFRAVFSEVAGKLFDVGDDQRIFPGWTGQRLPVLW